MADKKNVIVGAANLWIGTAAATGGTKPPAVSNTSYNTTLAASAGWRNVGYTQEGVELSYEPEFGEVEVDQVMDTVRMHQSSMRVTLNTTFAEATLENLVVVWGQTDATLVSSSDAGGAYQELTITSGELGSAPIERQLAAVGNGKEKAGAGVYNERTYHALRALSVDNSAHALRRNEATVFPVSFRLLPADLVGYGTIRDRARTWA